LSGIVLAGANQPTADGDDGVLTALEVAQMDLAGVDLVILSACETGLGRVAGGEGLLGLQRAFQVAGARSVVASLWRVPDSDTRDLMTGFHNNFWNIDMGKIEALHNAQLSILHGEDQDRGQRVSGQGSVVKNPRTPPYYWGAFVLSGDWR
jgi:CHAT domain-containing protein